MIPDCDTYDDRDTLRAQEAAEEAVKTGEAVDVLDCIPCGGESTAIEHPDTSGLCLACGARMPAVESARAGVHLAEDYEDGPGWAEEAA